MSVRVQILKVPTIVLMLVVLAFVARRSFYVMELRRVAKQVHYTGPPKRFPIAHFRAIAPFGARPETVWLGMTAYDSVGYYIAPIAGTADSVTIQRYRYPLRLGALYVDVLYLRGVVHDIEVDRQGSPGAPITAAEAYSRIGWRPR